jgi:1-acyl-sn-glycerol-3-phosphate acyltransferase
LLEKNTHCICSIVNHTYPDTFLGVAFLPALFLRLLRLKEARIVTQACGISLETASCSFWELPDVDGRDNLPMAPTSVTWPIIKGLLDIVAIVGRQTFGRLFWQGRSEENPLHQLWCYALDASSSIVEPPRCIKAILRGGEQLKQGKSMLVFPKGREQERPDRGAKSEA